MHGNSRDQWINKSFLRVAISLRNKLRCATSSRFVDTRRWISFKVSKVFEFLDTQGTRYSNLARSVYLFLPLTFYARCYKYYHVRICVYTLFQQLDVRNTPLRLRILQTQPIRTFCNDPKIRYFSPLMFYFIVNWKGSFRLV